MRVVEVIPIVRGIGKTSLTYFSKENFEPGTFVRVPVRKGSALAIVIRSRGAEELKSSLKSADYSLKKISVVSKAGSLNKAFMTAAERTAEYYATTIGNILSVLLPKLFLESPDLIGRRSNFDSPKEVKIIQLVDKERYREYRSIVRESFARDKSVLFIAPTKEECSKAAELLSAGIENYVYQTAGRTPKKVRDLIKSAREDKHPILFVTTASYLAFDRADLDTIIVEHENSRGYRTQSRPFIDMKIFLEHYARARGSVLILGDSILSLQTLWKEKEGEYSELTPLTWRLKTNCETEVIDMRTKKHFNILSDKLQSLIAWNLEEKKRIFLFGARKGFAPSTVCGDCGSLLLCNNCKSPLVLHVPAQASEPPIYICHHCGAKRSAETRCDTCQSWKLTPLGIGTDRIAEECGKLFPGAKIFVLDKEHASTVKQAKEIVKEYLQTEKAILVGTELALFFIHRVHLTCAVSLDSLFSIPDFYINEKIFSLITKLRELSTEKFVIQTRNASTEILEFAAAGNILDFYRTEMRERQELEYPPYSIFIKVSLEGDVEGLKRRSVDLRANFRNFDPHFVLDARNLTGKGILSMIIRQPRGEWPEKDLAYKLSLLSPEFLVKVDPESIL